MDVLWRLQKFIINLFLATRGVKDHIKSTFLPFLWFYITDFANFWYELRKTCLFLGVENIFTKKLFFCYRRGQKSPKITLLVFSRVCLTDLTIFSFRISLVSFGCSFLLIIKTQLKTQLKIIWFLKDFTQNFE